MNRTTIITTVAMALFLTMSSAYAETPNSVEVSTSPFDVTVLENGSITFTNQGTATWNVVSYGWFEARVEPASSVTIDLPINNCGTTCFVADDYFIKDLATGEYSILHIVKPIVVEPVYTPTIEYGGVISYDSKSLTGYVETTVRSSIDVKVYTTDDYGFIYNPTNDMSIGTTSTGGFNTSLSSLLEKYPTNNLFKFELLHNGVIFDTVFYHENGYVNTTNGGNERLDIFNSSFNVGVKPNGVIGIWNTGNTDMNLSWVDGNPLGYVQSGGFLLTGLPESQFPVGMYRIIDTNSGNISSVEVYSTQIVIPVVPEQVVEEVIVEENLVVSNTTVQLTNSTLAISQNNTSVAITTAPIITAPTINEGIYDVVLVGGDFDNITLQQQLAEITSNLNSALEKIGMKNAEITSLQSDISILENQVDGNYDYVSTLENHISMVEGDVVTLQSEVQAKETIIINLGNQVGQLNSDISSLHLNSTVSTEYVEQLEMDVATATNSVQSLTSDKLALQTALTSELENNSTYNDEMISLTSEKTALQSELINVTAEKEKWKQLANSWYTVALEQLRVMVNVLGI
jgi:hypothetical protein